MKFVRVGLLILACGFVVIQFFRPDKNIGEGSWENRFEAQPFVGAEVRDILLNSCYDCHSNNTRYPWYAEIQPVGWWLSGHIRDGKDELNFDEFMSYRPRRQYVKFREIEEMIEEDEMPLPSYALVHRDAVLSDEQKAVVIEWSRMMCDSMQVRYPADSLARR